MEDPWLEFEESYKREHACSVRYDSSWTNPRTYKPARGLRELNDRHQELRVLQLLRSGGFDRTKFAKRWEEVRPHEGFPVLAGRADTADPGALHGDIEQTGSELAALFSETDEGTRG